MAYGLELTPACNITMQGRPIILQVILINNKLNLPFSVKNVSEQKS
jgi:hypothetical protein